MKIATGGQMAAIDARTIQEMGVPGIVLMENAARAVCRAFLDLLDGGKPPVLVLCGSGNNGGDGFAIARILHGWGFPVEIVHAGRPQTLKPDALANYEAARKFGVPLVSVREDKDLPLLKEALDNSRWIVDALFGTGLSKQVLGTPGKALEMCAASGKDCVAVDIPSGINSDNGRLMGPVIPARLTVTFGLPKWGHVIFPGAEYVGKLSVADIGFPPGLLMEDALTGSLASPEEVARLIPLRPLDAHKGSSGKLAVMGGSRNSLGAATLSARAALAAGCGYVRLYVPNILETVVKGMLPDVVTEGLPDLSGGYVKVDATEIMLERLNHQDALVLGPGLGLWESTCSAVADILEECKVPVVVDADAITALFTHSNLKRDPSVPWVMTPHAGEAGRLLGKHAEEVMEDPVGSARFLVDKFQAVVLLKGPNTIVMNTDWHVSVNTSGNPALAVMGTGDILSGIVGALLARGIPAFPAAVAGAYIHGLMGDMAAGELYPEGIAPSQFIPFIPRAMQAIRLGDVAGRIGVIR